MNQYGSRRVQEVVIGQTERVPPTPIPQDAPLRFGVVTAGIDVARATDPDEILRSVTASFPDGTELYAVDHAFRQLIAVQPSESEAVALVGPLRRAVLRAESVVVDGCTWAPVSERDQTIFVARIPAEIDDLEAIEVAPGLGSILGGHRKRFERLETYRRRQNMSVAAELQWDLLPVRGDYFSGGRVAGILEPAYEVAGDGFDFAWADGALWAYSFDGMGHGVDATLTSAVALAAVRNARRRGLGLSEQMDCASQAIFEQWGGDRFVTGAGCRLGDGETQFVNAGHEPVRAVVGGNVERLDLVAELPLGVVEHHTYEVQRGPTLSDGDGIAMFSDGPGGASGSGGDTPLGPDGLDRILAERWSDRPFEAAHDTMRDVLRYIGDHDIVDDLTAVVLRLDSSLGAP